MQGVSQVVVRAGCIGIGLEGHFETLNRAVGVALLVQHGAEITASGDVARPQAEGLLVSGRGFVQAPQAL